MKTPGISTRPLIDMMNNHGFNEVFFENARIPASSLLGEENRGWYMATTTLDFERSSIGGAVEAREDARRARRSTRETRAATATGWPTRSACKVRLADAAVEAELGPPALVPRGGDAGARPGAELRVIDRQAVQHRHAAADGHAPAWRSWACTGSSSHKSKWVPLKGRFERQYLWQTGLAVGGGTTEIQKNIIAQRGLGTAAAVGSS